MLKFIFWRIYIFLELRGDYHYETRIDAPFAWALAGAMAEHIDTINGFEELKG